jgi:hypothetical protein
MGNDPRSLLVTLDRLSVVQHGSTMRPPPRNQPTRSAHLASSTVPSTLPHFSTSHDVPEVLERSTLQFSDVK